MSTLGNFLSSLLPRLNKIDVLEDIRITRGELENIVKPVYEDASRHFVNGKNIKSESLTVLNKVFIRNLEQVIHMEKIHVNRKRDNLILAVNDRIANLIENAKEIESKIEAVFEKDILRDGLTAKKAVLIRAAEYLSFISRYTIDLANYAYNEELYIRSLDDSFRDIPPAKIKLIEKNMPAFATLLGFFSIDPEEFKSRYESVPDVFVTITNYEKLSSVYDESKLNPVSAPIMTGFEYSPIYHIGTLWAEWQAARYKSYADKKQMLELKRLALQTEEQERKDPKIKKQIEILNERITKLDYKMASIEGK